MRTDVGSSATWRAVPELGCEFTFGNIFGYAASSNVSVGEFGGTFICRDTTDRPGYTFPLGDADLEKAIDFVIKDSAELGHGAAFVALTRRQAKKLESIKPGEFDLTPSRDHFDYIYRRQDLAELPGSKYRSKRHQVRRFFRDNPSARYERVTSGNVGECLDMTHRWLDLKGMVEHFDELQAEAQVIERALSYFAELELSGGLLRVNGEVVAYAVGEPLRADTFCAHFEKAFSNVHGAYAAIKQQFAANDLSDYEFVNWEEDLGQANLRKSKLSYKPCRLLEKSIAVLRG